MESESELLSAPISLQFWWRSHGGFYHSDRSMYRRDHMMGIRNERKYDKTPYFVQLVHPSKKN